MNNILERDIERQIVGVMHPYSYITTGVSLWFREDIIDVVTSANTSLVVFAACLQNKREIVEDVRDIHGLGDMSYNISKCIYLYDDKCLSLGNIISWRVLSILDIYSIMCNEKVFDKYLPVVLSHGGNIDDIELHAFSIGELSIVKKCVDLKLSRNVPIVYENFHNYNIKI